jgi:hypothetical protein
MRFNITVPKSLNFTPATLMKRHADNNPRYIYTCNRYFENCLWERATETTYYYDHWSIKDNADDTLTVTVFMYGIKAISDSTNGNHIYMKLELDGKIYEVDNYAGADGSWKQFKTTADGTSKREKVIKAFYTLY